VHKRLEVKERLVKVKVVVRCGRSAGCARCGSYRLNLSLYTILSLPIFYGVWHVQGGSGGVYIWRTSRAIVLQ